ncbi:MAG: hypothetical protein QOK40_1681, partial [Miltoncostaeaceae bacterium]|nr:hypothetical protein [Miltoncostaeaceae bacterium]
MIHPLVQFQSIAPAVPGAEEGHWQQPWTGELSDGQLDALIPLLAAATAT